MARRSVYGTAMIAMRILNGRITKATTALDVGGYASNEQHSAADRNMDVPYDQTDDPLLDRRASLAAQNRRPPRARLSQRSSRLLLYFVGLMKERMDWYRILHLQHAENYEISTMFNSNECFLPEHPIPRSPAR
jgi:hypothetical protein